MKSRFKPVVVALVLSAWIVSALFPGMWRGVFFSVEHDPVTSVPIDPDVKSLPVKDGTSRFTHNSPSPESRADPDLEIPEVLWELNRYPEARRDRVFLQRLKEMDDIALQELEGYYRDAYHSGGDLHGLASWLSHRTQEDPVSSLRFVEKLLYDAPDPACGVAGEAAQTAVVAWADRDPQSAAWHVFEMSSGPLQTFCMDLVMEHWCRVDFSAALDWISSRWDEQRPGADLLLARAAVHAHSGHKHMAEWFANRQHLQSSGYDLALSIWLYHWLEVDPVHAKAWIETLNAPRFGALLDVL